MRIKSIIGFSVVLLLALPLGVGAQIERSTTRSSTLLDNPIGKTFSLLDPRRLEINHSYSLSYYSGGGGSGSVGMYFSRLRYQIAKPLALYVNLGFAHNPSSLWGGQKGGALSEGFYPGFYLDYRPSSKFRLGIGYQRVPGYRGATRSPLPFFHGENPWWDISPER